MRELPNTTEAVLLSCLLNGERYGLEFRELFRARTGKLLPFGSLYVTLDRMEKAGLIRSRQGEETHQRGGNRRRYYRLLAAGHRAYDAVSLAIRALDDGSTQTGGHK